jgi:hypothetical protein
MVVFVTPRAARDCGPHSLGPGEYRRLKGTIRPDINDGSAVSGTVTVPSRDAVYLLKPRSGEAPTEQASAGR